MRQKQEQGRGKTSDDGGSDNGSDNDNSRNSERSDANSDDNSSECISSEISSSISSDAEDSSLDLSLGGYEIRTRPLGGGEVDLCVACGPFVHRHPHHHYRRNPESSYSQFGGGNIAAIGGTGIGIGDGDGDGGAGTEVDGSVGSSASGGSCCSCSCGEVGSLDEHDRHDEHGEDDDDDDDVDDVDHDDNSSSSGSSSSSAGGYDNTGGFGYRASNSISAHTSYHGRNRTSDTGRSSSNPNPHQHQYSHICARHLRRQQQQKQGYAELKDAAALAPTAEQDADAEGIVMSTLSQLENIVCRVLYIPGQGDPPSLYGRDRDDAGGGPTDVWDGPNDSDDSSRDSPSNDVGEGGKGGGSGGRKGAETERESRNGSLSTSGVGGSGGDGHGDDRTVPGPRYRVEEARHRSPYGDLIAEAELTPHKRLTPNSRNVHRRWVQLGPGLGVAGLARDAELVNGSGDGRGCVGGDRTGDRTISFDQGRYERTLGSLLSLSPPSRNRAVASSRMLTSKPSQAIVLTNLPGENERLIRGRAVQVKRRGKRDKDSRSQVGTADYCTGDDGIPIAYCDLLAAAAGKDEEDNQVLLKLASPPPQSDHHRDHGFSHTPAGYKQDVDQPREYEADGVKLVMPGSLRKSGDFALIDVALCKDDQRKSAEEIKRTEVAADVSVGSRSDSSRGRGAALNSNPQTRGRKLSPPSYRWRVHRVQFRSMDERGR